MRLEWVGQIALLLQLGMGPVMAAPAMTPAPVVKAQPQSAPEPEQKSSPDEKIRISATTNTKPAVQKPVAFNTIQQALYLALSRDQSPDAVALLIKQNLDTLSRPCEQIMAYQVFRYNSGARTLKVKCARQPLLALTITLAGQSQAIGGDGSIGDMLASDGRIYSVMGQTLKSYLDEQKSRETASANSRIANAPQVAADPVVHRKTNWTFIMTILTATLAVIAAGLMLKFFLAQTSARDHGWALSSSDKDYMMDESLEVYPNIFRHPRGFFISRGKRGKRRLFRSALAAMLYRDLGIKIGEIGE